MINIEDKYIKAITENNISMVAILAKNPLLINKTTTEVMKLVIEKDYEEIFKLLLSKGAEISYNNWEIYSDILESGSHKVLKALLEDGFIFNKAFTDMLEEAKLRESLNILSTIYKSSHSNLINHEDSIAIFRLGWRLV